MVNQRLSAHYSVPALISRVGFCGCLALMFWFVATQVRSQNWFAMTSYIGAAAMAGAALAFSYLLLTARGKVVVSMNAAGFKDTRLTQTAIPWNVIQSVSPYVPYKSRSPTGVELIIDPAFRRSLSIHLGAKLFAWANCFWGPAVRLDTSILDVDCNEISRVANSYISNRS